jgi:rSAM/selenodomain-associated transferase 1
MASPETSPVAIAVLAKAPLPAFAKTRLISVLGQGGAAASQARLIERAAETALAAGTGPVALWATPDQSHEIFQTLHKRAGVALNRQPDGDLGARMLAAIEAAQGPVLVIGTDCPVLTAEHLQDAAEILRSGTDVVILPAEDGGYVLIGMRKPRPELFADMSWSTAGVMAETRRRLTRLGLSSQEPATLWDVDRPADLERLRAVGLQNLIPEKS